MKRLGLLIAAVVVFGLLAAACQAAPTATPTQAPTATSVPQLAQPTPTKPPVAGSPTAAPPAAVATPVQVAATPTPKAVAKGKITMVTSAEPGSLDVILRGFTVENRNVFPSMVEELTTRNLKTFAVEGLLAEKWEQVKPETWRYNLRKGIKFHNGEPFDAEAVAYSLNRTADKDLASSSQRLWAAGGKATKVDDLTVDVTSTAAAPIQPLRLMYLPIVAPKWAKENPEELPIKVIATGPYKFVEWNRGQFIRITAFDEYWGTPATIKDATIVWRAEAAVRAAMIRTAEADWAYNITEEDAKKVPKVSAVTSTEVMTVRIDTENPVLKDQRVRLALNLAIDKDTSIKKLFGGFAEPAKGQIFGDYVIGSNPDLKPYPYDPEQAKKLVADAKAAGIPTDSTELDYWAAKGRFPHLEELSEVLADAWNKLGLKVKIVIAEQAKWREMSFATAPGQKRAAFLITGISNDLGDSALNYDNLVMCGGRQSFYCNKTLDEKAKQAGAAVGDDRAKLYREIWKAVYNDAVFIPVFRLKPIYGLSKRLNWEARMDDLGMVQEMTLTE